MSEPFWKANPRWWPAIADSIQGEWPREAVLMDLSWWADQVRIGRCTLPGRRALSKRWGWPERRARTILREVDPMNQGGVPQASHRRPTGVPPASRSTARNDVPHGSSVPEASHQRPGGVPEASTRALGTEHRTQNTEHRPPQPPQGGQTAQLELEHPVADPPPRVDEWEQLNAFYASLPGCKRIRVRGGRGLGTALQRILDAHGLEGGRYMLQWMAYASDCPKARQLEESGCRTLQTVGRESHVEAYWQHVERWRARGSPGLQRSRQQRRGLAPVNSTYDPNNPGDRP